MHDEPHDLMGQNITIKRGPHAGREMVVVDWWDHKMGGKSWQDSAGDGIIPALVYQSRQVKSNEKFSEGHARAGEYVNDWPPLPADDEVIHCVARDRPHPHRDYNIREDVFIHASELEDGTD